MNNVSRKIQSRDLCAKNKRDKKKETVWQRIQF